MLNDKPSCCAPSRPATATAPARSNSTGHATSLIDTVDIPGGRAETGTDHPLLPDDGEGPLRTSRIAPFRMDRTAVTNARFAQFVTATGYQTDAERFGWSFVFYAMLPEAMATRGAVGVEWWRQVEGAFWRMPEGPGTDTSRREDHPVTHLSWHDAEAFARWAGGRLPTEIEWEHAARGGLSGKVYPWGDRAPDESEFLPCNIWQGTFPGHNLGTDGHLWTAPAASFEPNGYGLFNMVGNSWEWCADAWRVRSLKKAARALNDTARLQNMRLMKGGSFLCHSSYCHRYRVAARHGNTADTSTSHISFRVIYPPARANA